MTLPEDDGDREAVGEYEGRLDFVTAELRQCEDVALAERFADDENVADGQGEVDRVTVAVRDEHALVDDGDREPDGDMDAERE